MAEGNFTKARIEAYLGRTYVYDEIKLANDGLPDSGTNGNENGGRSSYIHYTEPFAAQCSGFSQVILIQLTSLSLKKKIRTYSVLYKQTRCDYIIGTKGDKKWKLLSLKSPKPSLLTLLLCLLFK